MPHALYENQNKLWPCVVVPCPCGQPVAENATLTSTRAISTSGNFCTNRHLFAASLRQRALFLYAVIAGAVPLVAAAVTVSLVAAVVRAVPLIAVVRAVPLTAVIAVSLIAVVAVAVSGLAVTIRIVPVIGIPVEERKTKSTGKDELVAAPITAAPIAAIPVTTAPIATAPIATAPVTTAPVTECS